MRANRGGLLLGCLAGAALLAQPAYAMHIPDGILPGSWAALWFAISAPFLLWGLHDLRVRSEREPRTKALVGLVGAAVFIISCMPVPVPWVGTCSHPCGTGLAAILIGPAATVVVASIALTLQALFLAHGGLSTLGANLFSMGVVGAYVGYGVFKLGRRAGLSVFAAAFLAGMLSDWATYSATSLELAGSLPGQQPFETVMATILVMFAPTQIPLGLAEGAVSAMAYRFITVRRPELLAPLREGSSA